MRRQRLIISVMVLGGIFFMISIETSGSSGTTLYVGGSGLGNYTHIQDAIDNASSGDTIFVFNGIYYENVVVNKTISLIGEGRNGTIIDGGGSGNVISVEADGAAIEGFTIMHGEIGICLHYSNNCIITGNTISNSYWRDGISVASSSNCTIVGNTICNNPNGTTLINSNNCTITGNLINNNYIGIWMWYSSNFTISGNNISNNNGRGIDIVDSISCIITGNNISNNWAGIDLWGSTNNNLIYNNYFNNTNNAYDYGNNIWNISKAPGTNIIGGAYLGGNYWSDYTGVDTDGDGLGDTNLPYNCSGNIKNGGDYLPLIQTHFVPTIIYIDDDFNSSTPGWQYDHFDKIQDGIDAVAENGTVYVFNGTYYENVVVNKTINLIGGGRNGTIIDGGGSGDVIYVTADNVTISGFIVGNSGINWIDAGIKLFNIWNCRIENITASSNGDGICIYYYSNNNILKNCNTYNNSHEGILLFCSSNNILKNCNTYDNHQGIWLNCSSNNILKNCNTYDNHQGIWLLPNSNNNTITNCNIYSNFGDGVSLEFSLNNIITNCNILSNNFHGIDLHSSDSNIIYNNYFNNTINAYDDGNNIWSISKTPGTNIIGGPYLGGNYWSDFDEPSEGAYDNNSDGIVDSPYYISGGNSQDTYPLINLGEGLVVRSLPLYVDPAQETFVVSINLSDYGMFCEINETLPSGINYVGSSLPAYQVTEWSNGVRFIIFGETSFTYTVTTPAVPGEYLFSGIMKDEDKNTYPVGGDDTVTVWSPWLYDTQTPFGVITKPEVISAIMGYFDEIIEKWQAVEVIQLYFM